MAIVEQQPQNADAATVRLSLIIELERELRSAIDAKEFQFVLVNRLRELLSYHQAVLLRHDSGKRYSVEAISHIAVIQRDAPFVTWAQQLAKHLHDDQEKNAREGDNIGSTIVALESLPEHLRVLSDDVSNAHLLWAPLFDARGRCLGGLLLSRGHVWRESEQVLLAPVLDCAAHAWSMFLGRRHFLLRPSVLLRRMVMLAVISVIIAVMFLPVPQSSLAPSEVVAHKPDVVTAPLEGVIKRFLVEPNARVVPNMRLIEYEEGLFRNRLEIARREVELAEVELAQVTQDAFADSRSKAEQAVKQSLLGKKREERNFAQEEYDKVNIHADGAGIAIFHSPDDWIGRPVSLGQRLMLIADPNRVAIDAELPIKDAIETRQGARVQVFLDSRPLEPLEGTVLRTSYDAQPTLSGVMALRVRILLNADQPIPRIGAHGVSKIYGESVSLFFFLFRRPLSALRQMIGY